jgi:opacity protein-like surface antigen
MMRTLVLVLMLILLTFSMANAASVRLDFNNDSAEGAFAAPLADDDLGKVILGGRFLYNDDEDTRLGTINLDFVGEPGNVPGLLIGAGFFVDYGKTHKSFDTMNIGLGVQAQYAPVEMQGVGLGAHFALAPKVFSFRDSEGLYEAGAKVFYTITPKVQIYLGYQYIRGKFDNGPKQTFDRDLRLGIEAFF